MDYTNFVKNYYRYVIKKLNNFSGYNGQINLLNYGLEGLEGNTHIVNANLSVLPDYEINIDAPLSLFEDFLDYYSVLNPDLSLTLLGKDGLRETYKMVTEKEYNDEQVMELISLIVDVNIDLLAKTGVLSNANNFR